MNKITSVEEALQLFENITIKRGSALDADDFKTYNKQFTQVHKCIMYLYEHQQIHLLRIYFKHNNQHVRYSAASALLPLYEEESTHILSDIASGNYGLLSRRTMKIDNMKFGDMWLIYEIEKKIRLVEIIDKRIVKRERRETLSMGYYFLFAIINRIIHPVSKNKISDWLRKYDLRTIFGIEIDHHKFTSDAYWQRWNRVKLEDIEYISNELFIRCCKLSGIEFKSSACSYDTSNFFLFMSSTTDSELAERGKNKQGRDNLRQIGLSILVDNYTGLILHYKIYKGNMHDSKVFYTVINDMIAQAKRCGKEDFTIVFDKGMNSDENIAELDKINKEYKCTFVTSYSTSDEHNLMRIPLNNYHIINCKHNTQINQEKNRHPENAEKLENSKVRAFSLHRSFWGKERNVVLLYSPETAKKQKYLFDKNLEKLRNWIIEAQKKIKANSPYYRNESSVVNLYRKEAIKYHISPDVFELSFSYDGIRPILKDVNAVINEGEMLSIVGKNGAGKTTLSSILCGFIKPDEGYILMEGEDLSKYSISERAEYIGIVMQNPNQMISKTMIFDEVAFGLRIRNIDESTIEKKVYEVLKICGLYEYRNWPISALSFGQKKRVTIASILVLNPKILQRHNFSIAVNNADSVKSIKPSRTRCAALFTFIFPMSLLLLFLLFSPFFLHHKNSLHGKQSISVALIRKFSSQKI